MNDAVDLTEPADEFMKEVESPAKSGVPGAGEEQADVGAKVAEDASVTGQEQELGEKQHDA